MSTIRRLNVWAVVVDANQVSFVLRPTPEQWNAILGFFFLFCAAVVRPADVAHVDSPQKRNRVGVCSVRNEQFPSFDNGIMKKRDLVTCGRGTERKREEAV